jgi:hypothetical protein
MQTFLWRKKKFPVYFSVRKFPSRQANDERKLLKKYFMTRYISLESFYLKIARGVLEEKK